MSKTGGPAFPRSGTFDNGPQDGMTLLDYFAGQAMNALVQGRPVRPSDKQYGEDCNGNRTYFDETEGDYWAKEAYSMAESMLAEKARREK